MSKCANQPATSAHWQSFRAGGRIWPPDPDMPAPMKISGNLRRWAKRIKRDGVTLWFAGKNPRTPWYAKALGVFVVAYALSPIDLIPDFIPVLGYVDDVLLLPVLIWLAIRLLPPEVLAECRSQAEEWMQTKGSTPRSGVGALFIVVLWLAVGVVAWLWLKPHLYVPE